MITVCIYCIPRKDYKTNPTDLLEGLIAHLLYLHQKLKSRKLYSLDKIKVCPHIHNFFFSSCWISPYFIVESWHIKGSISILHMMIQGLEKKKYMQLNKSLKLFTAVIVTGSEIFTWVVFFHLLIDLSSKSNWVFLLNFQSVARNYLAPIKQKKIKTACYHMKNVQVMAGWGLEKRMREEIYYQKNPPNTTFSPVANSVSFTCQ